MSPILSRSAISFRATATSSACARLSNWQGPAITASGRSLPKVTLPTDTVFEAETKGMLRVEAPFCRERGTRSRRSRRLKPLSFLHLLENQRRAECNLRRDDHASHPAVMRDAARAQLRLKAIEFGHLQPQAGQFGALARDRFCHAELIAKARHLHEIDVAMRRHRLHADGVGVQQPHAGEGGEN